MLKVINVVGARPNFMKVAPIFSAMKRRNSEFSPLLLHTGQHYDKELSELFFRELGLPEPDIHLGVGSQSHAMQTAAIMQGFEPVVLRERPDWVLVVGDVNSTLACSLVCSKLRIKVVHVEAGLRSRDRTMPEEINRLLTDQISDLLLTPSSDADQNLLAEGIEREKIRMVGNVMIDSLFSHMERAKSSKVAEKLGLLDRQYGVLTLHRPSNVDDKDKLAGIIGAVKGLAKDLQIIFPVHPRTEKRLEDLGIRMEDNGSGLRFIKSLGYVDFLSLYSRSALVLTDSGGIQEETTALGIPCLTLRENTERPITVEIGTNRVVGTDPERIVKEARSCLSNRSKDRTHTVPPLWDGKTADRILDAILSYKDSKIEA
jgi:UDP-N-acetylglucosamine 2-epimerase (non-hydrolysing)